uniref:Reverse transcriptase domain-containing protein n=1 Tax=Tanacetum cinerariifolium TaxID=118510 RepID=A0A6L2JSF2_TANCI|nr:reverse transcriptase domain-containing protein [Tanacetum cinerariifolium]
MRTRSSSNLPVVSPYNPSNSNPKRRNHKRSKQAFILEESLVDTMADQCTMAELLRAPTEGYAEAIVVPLILAEQFELKHSLINMMISDQFFGLEKDNPHDHIRWFNKITSTIKYKDVPNSAIKLMLLPLSLAGAARRWLEKEPPRSILTWEDLVSKFLNEFFPPSRTINLRNEISNFQQRFDESFHEAWDRYKDLLRACPHYGFTELHQLNTFYNALNTVDQHSLNAAAGGNLLERCELFSNSFKQPHLQLLEKFVEEICVTCGGAHLYYQCLAAGGNTFSELKDNIQGYVSAVAVNYNQGSSLPSNTVANPKGELKAITTRSGIVLDAPSIPTPPFINPEVDERVEETLIDQDLSEYTIKVPPPPVQKYKPPSQRDFFVHQRDPLHPNIPYPLRMLKQKQQEKDEVQIHKFWQMFKQLHINITLADALNLMPKYHKMLKALLSNKEKLQELANTPLNENCSAVILKKLPEKLRDPGKFLIPYGFNELKCKALADLGDSIKLMPLFVWKKLRLPELISTRMTLELANRVIFTSAGITRDVFVPVGKFTFPADFVIVEYEKVKDDIFDPEVANVLSEKLLDLDSTKDLHPPHHVNPLSGSTTYSFSANQLLEEFTDELALITFSLKYDNDLQFDIEFDLKEIEYLLYHNPIKDIDSSLKNLIDQKSKLLIDELDLPCDSFLSSEYDLILSKDFSMVDALPSTNNEDKVFNPGILIQENLFEIITRDVQDKKLTISNASLMIKDFDPPLYKHPFFKEVPRYSQNVKTHAKGFCPPVFISSASFGNHRPWDYNPGKLWFCSGFTIISNLDLQLRSRRAGATPSLRFLCIAPLPRYAGNPNNNNGCLAANDYLLGELEAMVDEQMVVPVIEEMDFLMIDMEEDLVGLFGEDDDFKNDSEGVDEEEAWEVNEEWLMAPVTPPLVPVVQLPSVYEVGCLSTAVAEGPAFPHLAPRLSVPPFVIEDLSTHLGNLEYENRQMVHRTVTQIDETIVELTQQVHALQIDVQQRDTHIQHLQTTITEMGSRESTLMRCILGLERRIAALEKRPLGP